MEYAKFTWTPAGGSLTSYTLAANYSFATKPFLQDASDHGRAIDGTLRTYNVPLKESWLLSFKNISLAQREQLKTIKEAQVDINFYQDGVILTFIAQWVNTFNFTEIAPGIWGGTIQLEEV
jgi:hypothetical protein